MTQIHEAGIKTRCSHWLARAQHFQRMIESAAKEVAMGWQADQLVKNSSKMKWAHADATRE